MERTKCEYKTNRGIKETLPIEQHNDKELENQLETFINRNLKLQQRICRTS